MATQRRRSNPKIQPFWLPITVLLFVFGCQTAGDTGGAQNAWYWGKHRVPQASLREGQYYTLVEISDNPTGWYTQVPKTKLIRGTKLPAVIYLHGCAGNTAGHHWGRILGQLGFAFFAPDSLARPRDSLCWTGGMDYRISLRREEYRYALAELRKLSWIDQKRIILMGSSEGAQAASDYSGHDFAAIVLSATDCRFSGGSPSAPRDVPVLNMVGEFDDKGGGAGCIVSRTVGGSKSVTIKRAGHKLPGYREARKVLEKFLKACCAVSD